MEGGGIDAESLLLGGYKNPELEKEAFMIIEVSNVCSSFEQQSIGTKVLDANSFKGLLSELLEKHDRSKDQVKGQHFIVFPVNEINNLVSSGTGIRTEDPNDYVLRCHRGRVQEFLKREKATAVNFLAAVAYGRSAYLSDPDVVGEKDEQQRIYYSGCDYVIVAVLAGDSSPLTPYRFTHNLAGGNKEAEVWGLDEIRAKAKEVKEFWDGHCTVAD